MLQFDWDTSSLRGSWVQIPPPAPFLFPRRFQVVVCRAVDHFSRIRKARPVARAVKRLFRVVPLYDAAKVRADGRVRMELAFFVPVVRYRLLLVLFFDNHALPGLKLVWFHFLPPERVLRAG